MGQADGTRSVDFDPGPGVYELVRPSTHETAYVLSLTGAGYFRWAVPLGGNAGRSQVQGISVTSDNRVHLSGAFRGNADFNPHPVAETWLDAGTVQSVFVATLAQTTPDPGAPNVDAGLNQTIPITAAATLDGTVTDDGLPNPLITIWSLQSGPGTVVFADASAVDTTATFSASGTYVLQLQANDGQSASTDYVQIVVNPLITALTVAADTHIADGGGNANKNFGTSTNLLVDGNPDNAALLRWDLSTVPAGSTLKAASLSLHVTGTSTNTYEIYELKRNWSELQATWNKATSASTWQSAGAQGSSDRGSTVLGTITATASGVQSIVLNAAGMAVVQNWINNPAANFGFIIQDYANSNKDDLVISSKNSTVAANRPQLQVLYNPPNLSPTSLSSAATVSQSNIGTATALMLPEIAPDKNGESVVKLSRTSSLSQAASTALPSNLDLLTASMSTDTNIIPKRRDVENAQLPQAVRAASMDKALEEIDYTD